VSSTHIQLVDAGGHFEDQGQTLTGTEVKEFTHTDKVKAALRGRIVHKVDAPAEAAEPAASTGSKPEKGTPPAATSKTSTKP
jgi:hypothetical protein